jgi:DNA repair protein RecO (recombination protein O)
VPDQIHKTKGIVLRSIKYGETSLVVTIFTEIFGIQSYLVNGVRTSSKKGSGKANLFQPAAILDLVVYHNELKKLNRIKEFKWGFLYTNILSDVPRNAIALFMVELLLKSLKQPEPNADLFYFVEDSFLQLDNSQGMVMANLPLFFILHLAHFFGFRLDDNYSASRKFLDLSEGSFTEEQPHHPHFIEGREAELSSQLLKVMQPQELAALPLNQELRRQLFFAFEKFYALHIPDFGTLRSLPVLKEILS